MGKQKIQKQLTLFIERVKKKIQPEKIILFGSYAQKRANDYSDIDVIVISHSFNKMKEKERFDYLYELSKDLYPDINAFGITPREEKKINRLSTMYEALKTGITIS